MIIVYRDNRTLRFGERRPWNWYAVDTVYVTLAKRVTGTNQQKQ